MQRVVMYAENIWRVAPNRSSSHGRTPSRKTNINSRVKGHRHWQGTQRLVAYRMLLWTKQILLVQSTSHTPCMSTTTGAQANFEDCLLSGPSCSMCRWGALYCSCTLFFSSCQINWKMVLSMQHWVLHLYTGLRFLVVLIITKYALHNFYLPKFYCWA